MRAVILAAGDGGRLAGASGGVPKALLSVGGASILDRQLGALAAVGVGPFETTVVGGWRASKLRGSLPAEVSFAKNADWETTETLASLLCGLRRGADTLVLHGDVVLRPGLLRSVLKSAGDVVVPVDAESADEEAMKVYLRDGSVWRLSKESSAHCAGESMGVFLLRRRALPAFLREGRAILAAAPGATADDVVTALARRPGTEVAAVDVTGCDWEEVDTPGDLKRAREIFGSAGAWNGVWEELDTRSGDGLLQRAGRWLAARGDLQRLVLEVLFRRGGPAPCRVLEAGCGSGAVLAEVDRRADAIGFDLSPEAVDMARRRGLAVFRGDVTRPPLSPGRADTLYSVGVLDQLSEEELPRALEELCGAVSPGGRLIIVTASSRCRLHEAVKRRLARKGRWPFGRKRAFESLRDEVLSACPNAVVGERHMGLLIGLRTLGYLAWRRPAVRRLVHGAALALSALLWPLNRLPGMVLVTEVLTPEDDGGTA